MHRQLGPLFTFTRPQQYTAAQGILQQQQNVFQFEAAAILAREYRSILDRMRQRQMAELQAQLANGTVPGFKTVRLMPNSLGSASLTLHLDDHSQGTTNVKPLAKSQHIFGVI